MFSLMCVCQEQLWLYFFKRLSYYEGNYACLQPASATPHTTDDSVLAYFWWQNKQRIVAYVCDQFLVVGHLKW